jgi:hypothetical protein
MPAIRNILAHVIVETADGARICHRNRDRHRIAKGERHLAIYGGPRDARKNYCRLCARPILDEAQATLTAMFQNLFS